MARPARHALPGNIRSEEHTSELQSLRHLVCRLLLEKKLPLKAMQNQPDYRAAREGGTAPNSQYDLQKAIGKPDVTVQANFLFFNTITTPTFFSPFPLPTFIRI